MLLVNVLSHIIINDLLILVDILKLTFLNKDYLILVKEYIDDFISIQKKLLPNRKLDNQLISNISNFELKEILKEKFIHRDTLKNLFHINVKRFKKSRNNFLRFPKLILYKLTDIFSIIYILNFKENTSLLKRINNIIIKTNINILKKQQIILNICKNNNFDIIFLNKFIINNSINISKKELFLWNEYKKVTKKRLIYLTYVFEDFIAYKRIEKQVINVIPNILNFETNIKDQKELIYALFQFNIDTTILDKWTLYKNLRENNLDYWIWNFKEFLNFNDNGNTILSLILLKKKFDIFNNELKKFNLNTHFNLNVINIDYLNNDNIKEDNIEELNKSINKLRTIDFFHHETFYDILRRKLWLTTSNFDKDSISRLVKRQIIHYMIKRNILIPNFVDLNDFIKDDDDESIVSLTDTDYDDYSFSIEDDDSDDDSDSEYDSDSDSD